MTGLVQRLIPEFEVWKRRYPAGFDGSLSIPALRRIQEERGYIADEDITDLTAYLGVPRTRGVADPRQHIGNWISNVHMLTNSTSLRLESLRPGHAHGNKFGRGRTVG